MLDLESHRTGRDVNPPRILYPTFVTRLNKDGETCACCNVGVKCVSRASIKSNLVLHDCHQADTRRMRTAGTSSGAGLNTVDNMTAYRRRSRCRLRIRPWIRAVPFCEWGCAIRSCVDCASPDGAVFTFDPNTRHPDQDMSTSLAAMHSSLDAWFRDWIAVLHSDDTGTLGHEPVDHLGKNNLRAR
jgi:hypothetical protein